GRSPYTPPRGSPLACQPRYARRRWPASPGSGEARLQTGGRCFVVGPLTAITPTGGHPGGSRVWQLIRSSVRQVKKATQGRQERAGARYFLTPAREALPWGINIRTSFTPTLREEDET